MLQYILTALAGVALGIVGMRVWQSQHSAVDRDGRETAETATDRGTALPARGEFLSTGKMLAGAGVLVLAALALFLTRNQADEPAAGTGAVLGGAGTASQTVDDVDSMISRLVDRLKQNPGDGEGFRMLGWSFLMTGHPDKALEPYKRALSLLPRQANVHAGYGEVLVALAKNSVTDEAKVSFERALAIDPKEPRARYFHALWQAQHGQQKEALDQWIALANDTPTDASWQADLRNQIAETSSRLGLDVSSRLKVSVQSAATGMPTLSGSDVQAAQQLPAGERQEMIDGMVSGLAARLKANPRDADGWVRLMRSRMVLGQTDQAVRDLAAAKAAFGGDAVTLQKLDMAAEALRVPGGR